MPIHEVGYRSWDGERTSQFSRWSVICVTGIRLASKPKWVRRILFVAWLPVMYWGVGFFFLEKTMDANDAPVSQFVGDFSEETLDQKISRERNKENARKRLNQLRNQLAILGIDDPGFQEFEELALANPDLINNFRFEDKSRPELLRSLRSMGKSQAQREGTREIRRALRNRFSLFPHTEDLVDSLDSGDKERIRNDVWRWLLMIFFRYPQSLLILFLIGTVAPSLISRDLRSRAFLLYFSRPIGKLEYMLGKLCIPAAFIMAVTTLPALALYIFAIMMSPSLTVFWSTWDIPLRILGASVALVVPTSAIALMLSSLTHESRFANFSWFAVWALGHGAWLAIVLATAMGSPQNAFHPAVQNSAQVKNWSMLSLYNCLGDVQAFIFGFESLSDVWRGTLALACITIFSLIVLYRRISAPVRV